MKTTIEVLKQLYAFCEKRQKEINVSQGDTTTGMSKAFEEVKKEIEVLINVGEQHIIFNLSKVAIENLNAFYEREYPIYMSGIVNFEPVENINESRFKKFYNKIKRFFGFKKNKVDSFYIK